MSTKWYGKIAGRMAGGEIDLVEDDIKVMLVDSTYAMDDDAHETVADITGEITGAGYTAGGKSLTGKTWTHDTSASVSKWTFDADDLTFNALTATFRHAVLYDNTHPDKPLIACVRFSADQTASNQDMTIKWEYLGQFSVTHHGILDMGYY